ncbi:energy-coupling factor ABC transporter permease [Oceanobacter mangrovi]|uniref:energy-coupling factor ABC transporter permease n=1 Tax=Oceanobacter mangrovi TaxID=2862510 RepID=UPI001C8D4D44|nr:energy-coupling factor ABC transporter permease [Oceanobacter mangrovi]
MTPLLPDWMTGVLMVGSLALLAYATATYRWQALREQRIAQHLFFGCVLVLSLFWHATAGILPGLEFHILALTSATLLMGWRLALVASALMQLIQLLLGEVHWADFGYHFLIENALPIAFTWQFYSLVYRRLPHNPFVYILVAGFINAGFTHAFLDLLQSGIYALTETYPAHKIWHDYLRYMPMMMFPEGVVNGMFIAGMVAFHTEWLSTFDEDSYFK